MYLLDANVFIGAKQRHYRFEVCPGFWAWLDLAHEQGSVASIRKVSDELVGSEDELSDWASERSAMFLEPDEDVVASMGELSTWAFVEDYTAAARDVFLDAADYDLVAHAHAHRHAVVTHERPNPRATGRIKIPDACDAFGVRWLSPFDMLSDEGAKFILDT